MGTVEEYLYLSSTVDVAYYHAKPWQIKITADRQTDIEKVANLKRQISDL